ncbi:hypothetical protein PsorP6_000786 [Peronosclerospora sorghi]|uniref:Uncharacterized protein n=1 Tax=Peronosclerospora sorghi TaxID=230839 RepID=A0ACC0WPG8_9STRA|nr:hypothetical protein PsorP6_000786 [Peronosclerospora sorghi]
MVAHPPVSQFSSLCEPIFSFAVHYSRLSLRLDLGHSDPTILCLFFTTPSTRKESGSVVRDKVISQPTNTGYNNLMSHLSAQHESFEDVAQEIADINGTKRATLEMLLEKDACSTMKTLRLVAVKNFPICTVDDQDVKDSVHYKSLVKLFEGARSR